MKRFLIALVLVCLAFTGVAQAEGEKNIMGDKTAIVIAAFGTTYETTLEPILALVEEVQAKYPESPVRLAFTSNIIRKIWNNRAVDAEYRNEHPNMPEILYNVKNVLGELAELQNLGYRSIVVQPTLITDGEEYRDLLAYVDALDSIKTMKEKFKPFKSLAVGKPLTGDYDHSENIEALAKALENDAKQAKASKAALVYMGHGNEHMSQGSYYELELVMNRMYNIPVMVGLVEGLPDYESVLEKIKAKKVKKVILKPLMYVAGDHASNDMAGDDDDSWKIMLKSEGVEVLPVLEGLGKNKQVREIFIGHLEDAAEEAGIKLN